MISESIQLIATTLNLPEKNVKAAADLLSQDATIPFIARYRKEVTGSFDEVILTQIRNLMQHFKDLNARKDAILKSLDKNGHLTQEITQRIEAADTLAILEDIYLPYKPKRKTRASVAREKGLEPLADIIFKQGNSPLHELANRFLSKEKDVLSIEDALKGANDIIAEVISLDSNVRSELRHLFLNKSIFTSMVAKNMEATGIKYKNYYDWNEPVTKIPSHRVLAMRRGEKEGVLNLSIQPPFDDGLKIVHRLFVKGGHETSGFVAKAAEDSYKRLLSKSLETEIRISTKEKADSEAIRIFSDNLRQLLLEPPLGARKTIGIDPGFRTGCKLVCLDQQGKLLEHHTIYINMGKAKDEDAKKLLIRLCTKHQIEAIAIGNGTGGRETELFIRNLPLSDKIEIVMVNESGASIYSASDIAREEFPDIDLTVRGSVSIGRRLMDPLSELVKIEPKSIGVGQYQHDVDQGLLKSELDDVVISCVNNVGVDVNTASARLLTYVSGIGSGIAKNIVLYRDANGPFNNRKDLSNVPRLGPKAYEQAAGFLRIRGGKMPLDTSAVHPESYYIVDKMASDLQCSVDELIKDNNLKEIINLKDYITDDKGLPTLIDIMEELKKPGRDPREAFSPFSFADGVDKITDLREEMELQGIVTNITAFGAFIDIGVHQDGLVHISEMSDSYVKSPASIVKVHQKVNVRVLEIDVERKRISLSMKRGQKAVRKTTPERKTRQTPKKVTPKQGFNNPFAEAFQKNR